MARILHVDSSPRGDRSISRTLTKEFVNHWQQTFPNDTIIYRDVGRFPVPAVDEFWIAASASLTPRDQLTPELNAALKLSDELIDELLATDLWVFGVPMYNYSVPSNFKAYIDQIVRARRTFTVTDQGEYKGLVFGKKAVVITARGGTFSSGTPDAEYDFQEPFLKAVFNLMGITDLTFIHAENLAGGFEARQRSLTDARAAIQQFVAIHNGSEL